MFNRLRKKPKPDSFPNFRIFFKLVIFIIIKYDEFQRGKLGMF